MNNAKKQSLLNGLSMKPRTHQGFGANGKSLSTRILGKRRKREQAFIDKINSLKHNSFGPSDGPNDSSNSRSLVDEVNFITQNTNPIKRRHVSSMSKAMLAKKILSKIETENDPFQVTGGSAETTAPIKKTQSNNEESTSKSEESTHPDI